MYLLFDLLIVVICAYTLKNFSRGFLAMLCMTVAAPWMVQLKLGATYMTYTDFFAIFLLVPLFFQIVIKRKRLNRLFVIVVLLDLITTFLLMIFSSQLVPFDYQQKAFIKKKVYQEGIFLIAGILAFQNMDRKEFSKTLFGVSLVCGIYGIVAYFLVANPYVNYLILYYTGQESVFAFFLEESRGGMLGRTYGTMTHPLAWGQYWGLLLSYYFFINRNHLNRFIKIGIPVVAVANCLFSGSRTSLLMVGAVFVIWLFSEQVLSSKKGLRLLLCFVVAIVCALPVVVQNSAFASYIESTVFFWDSSKEQNNSIEYGSSSDLRERQLAASMKMVENTPFAGVGYDFQYYSLENVGVANRTLMGFESILFKKIVEQGYIGLIVFFVMILLLYKSVVNNQKSKQKRRLALGFFLASVLGFIFTGIQGRSWMYFLCLLFAMHNEESVNQEKTILRISNDS